ncbi:MAG: peptidoglycan-associated lipoprotein [Salinisphaeraceae bacterium]|nr:peptidoglycan-associated lipoprotein [Salinisphaeraceae bacterium]
MKTQFATSQRKYALRLVFASLVIALAGCAGNEPLPDEPVDAPVPQQAEQRPASSGGTASGPQIDASRLNERGLQGIPMEDRAMFLDPNNPLSTRIIYFDFDSSQIPARFEQAITAHANYLANHRNITLRLEGHTDERGTREYNVGLGERRAQAVERGLTLSGAGAEQITTLSFGEERPAAFGSDDSAYDKNRRVELIYVKR